MFSRGSLSIYSIYFSKPGPIQVSPPWVPSNMVRIYFKVSVMWGTRRGWGFYGSPLSKGPARRGSFEPPGGYGRAVGAASRGWAASGGLWGRSGERRASVGDGPLGEQEERRSWLVRDGAGATPSPSAPTDASRLPYLGREGVWAGRRHRPGAAPGQGGPPRGHYGPRSNGMPTPSPPTGYPAPPAPAQTPRPPGAPRPPARSVPAPPTRPPPARPVPRPRPRAGCPTERTPSCPTERTWDGSPPARAPETPCVLPR